jgi:tetratricopeptide (TPR) repeat protein
MKPDANKPMTAVMLIATVLVGLAFWNAPQGQFVFDDQKQVVRNPLVQNPALWRKALTSDVWAFKSPTFDTVSNYYRPVFTAWTIANFTLFELEPAGWHVANILLHLLVVWLALKVLVRLGFSWPVAAAAAWIFAAHPVHVESVTWIAGSPDLLMAAFLLWALDAYLRLRGAPTFKGWAVALGATLLAMGSKEAALMMAPAAFVIELAMSKSEGRKDALQRGLRLSLPFVGVIALFLVLRGVALGTYTVDDQSPASLASVLLSVPELVFFYFRQALAPFWLSSAYPLRAVSPSGLTLTAFWLPLAFTLAAVVGLVQLARKNARWAAALAVMLFILPAFYIRAFSAEHVVRDRYLYLPLLGLVVLLLDVVSSRAKRAEGEGLAWNGTTIGGLVAAVGLAVLSMLYNPVWMSDVALWRRGVETDPNSTMANMMLAESLRTDKSPEEAVPYAEKAVSLSPKVSRPLTVLGMAYKDLGDYPKAESALKRAIANGYDTTIAAGQLAEMYVNMGRHQEAVEVFEAEIGRNPGYKLEGRQNVATVYVLSGHRDKAAIALESIRTKARTSPVLAGRKALFLLGQLYTEMGEYEKATTAFKEFLEVTEGWEDPATQQMRDQAASRL